MALSYVEYVGNGTQTDFSFSFPYISRSHVKVFVNNVDTPFTFFSSSVARVTPAPINGVTVRVARITPDSPLVNFVDGSTLTEVDLDTATLQAIYLAQEAVDKAVATAGTVTASQITDASANGRSLITALDYAAMKTLLAITAADITNASADGRSLITATNYAAMRSLLGFTTANITDMSANGRSLVTAADYAAMRTLLGFTTANITDMSANGRSLVTAANYAAMKTLLAVTAADITNASANGRSLITAADYAAMRALLGFTTTNITDMSANGRSLVTAADYAAMRTLLGLGTGATAAVASQVQAEAGTDNTTLMTPLRTAQAIAALGGGGGGSGSALTTTFSPTGNIAATNVQAAIAELDTEKAAASHTHTAADISNASANGRSLITAADYAAMKTLLAITAADITNASADGRSILTAANFAAMRTLLGLTAPATASFASNAQAVAGTDNTTVMTPLRTAEAITALGGGGGGGSVPVGTIARFLENPGSGWLLANGAWASRTTYAALFAAFGTSYGDADGVNNFATPRIQSRVNLLRTNTALPAGRAWHSMIALNDGRLIIIGGNSGTEASPVMTNTVYFGAFGADGTITWTAGTNYPVSAAGISVVQLTDGRLCCVGGMTSASASTNAVYFGTISGDTITWAAGTNYPTNIGGAILFEAPDGRIWVGGGFDTAAVQTTRFGTISGDTITWVTSTALPFTGTNFSYDQNGTSQYLFVPPTGTGQFVVFTNGSNTVSYIATSTAATLGAGNSLTHLPCGSFVLFQNGTPQQYILNPQTGGMVYQGNWLSSLGTSYTVATAARMAAAYVPQQNAIVICGGLNGGSALASVRTFYAIETAYIKT